jgi:hypothetical protein
MAWTRARWARASRAAAIAALGVLCARQAWRAGTRDPTDRVPFDRVLAPLVAALPPGERVIEYVGPEKGSHDANTKRVIVQFAVAPVLLVDREPSARHVIAWSDDPEEMKRLGASRGGRLVGTFWRGFGLFERDVR